MHVALELHHLIWHTSCEFVKWQALFGFEYILECLFLVKKHKFALSSLIEVVQLELVCINSV